MQKNWRHYLDVIHNHESRGIARNQETATRLIKLDITKAPCCVINAGIRQCVDACTVIKTLATLQASQSRIY